MQIAFHHQSLPVAAEPPEWVQLLPAGTWRGVDGRGPYTLASTAEVIAASLQSAGGKIPLDENHATEIAKTTAAPSPARGWIDSLQERDGAIWGRVDWNASGAALYKDRAYRGISPAFEHTKDGRIVAIRSVAMTNTPNIGALPTLHSQQDDPTMDFSKIRAALGLTEQAGEADVLGAIDRLSKSVATHSQQLADAAKLQETVIALQTQLSTVQAEQARARAVAAIDAAIAAGKPILPLREHLIARHMQDAAAVDKELLALPSINAGGVALHAQQSDDGEPTLTESEKSTADKMGVKHEHMLAEKKKRMEGSRK